MLAEIILGIIAVLSILSNVYFIAHCDKKIKDIVYFHGVSDEVRSTIAINELRSRLPKPKPVRIEPEPEDEMDYGNIGDVGG